MTEGGDLTPSYLERLGARTAAVRSCLCLGIDPDVASLPTSFSADLAGVEAFARLLLDAAAPYAAAVKANLAFFEAFGSAGIGALERLRARVPSDLPFIADAKRGDIGSTAAKQATALFDVLDADAVTVNPYLGAEAIAPLLDRGDRFAYALCRTSNPGAGELQSLIIAADGDDPAEPLYARVARRAAGWGRAGTVGLVVGATGPAELGVIRGVAPGLAFLVPGLGAQGGDLSTVLDLGPATAAPAGGRPGGGLLANVSRGIAAAASGPTDVVPAGGPDDPGERIAQAAERWSRLLPVLP